MKWLAGILWLIAPQVIAQDCRLVVSPSTISMGNKLSGADKKNLFAPQILEVKAECVSVTPATILIDGTPDDSGKNFRFGNKAQMTLTLLSAQYNGHNTALSLISLREGKKQLAAGQSVLLEPGSQLTVPVLSAGSGNTLLTLQMRIDFPVYGDEGRVRELTQFDGQLRFEVTQ